jgi:hypothetical protein
VQFVSGCQFPSQPQSQRSCHCCDLSTAHQQHVLSVMTSLLLLSPQQNPAQACQHKLLQRQQRRPCLQAQLMPGWTYRVLLRLSCIDSSSSSSRHR